MIVIKYVLYFLYWVCYGVVVSDIVNWLISLESLLPIKISIIIFVILIIISISLGGL